MNLIYQSGFLKALGWSLVDSLWQMGLVWLLYICITANGHKRSAEQRHNLALLSLAGGSAWFIVDLFISLFSAKPVLQAGTAVFGNPLFSHSVFSSFLDGIAPYFSIIYLVTLLFLIARFLYQYQQNLRLFHTGIQEPGAYLSAFVDKTVDKMGIPKKVAIGLSAIADTPLTIGFWKPVILFPVAVFNQLSISQAEAIIVHELHHIKRNDYLINLLLALTDIIFFFNPFARILSAIVKKERENSCDDAVLQFQYNPHQYGQALLILEQNRQSGNNISISVAATGRGAPMLLNRIKRLASHRSSPSPVLGKLSALLFFLLLATTVQQREETGSTSATPSFTGENIQVSFTEKMERPVEALADAGTANTRMPVTGAIAGRTPAFQNPTIENPYSDGKKIKKNQPEPSSPASSAEKNTNNSPTPETEPIQVNNGYNDNMSGAAKIPDVFLQALSRDEDFFQTIAEINLSEAGGYTEDREINLSRLTATILVRRMIASAKAVLLLQAADLKNLEEQIAQASQSSFVGYPVLAHTLSLKPGIRLISLSGNTLALIGQNDIIYIIQVNSYPQYRLPDTGGILKTVHL